MAGISCICMFSQSPKSRISQLGVSMGAYSRQINTFSHARCQLLPLPQSAKSLPLHSTVLPCGADDSKIIEELQERTRMALQKSSDPKATMKLIDNIQRLGIDHHFEEEINEQLERFSNWDAGEDDLFVIALRFRLLRHSSRPAHADVFNKFFNKDGKLKEPVFKDTWGMLSLYEASYLATKDEDMLLQAMRYTRTHLEQSMPFMNPHSRRHVAQALELPRQLRMARWEARNYIDEYSKESNYSLSLLELAKLDFDTMQKLHQIELTEIFRWWRQLGLLDKLPFARDRPLECFLWTVGILPQPCYSSCRIELAKTIAILLVIDDIYDTYGSLDELVLFTDAIRRWDLSAMEQLPEYMKICYMALYNTTNDIAYRVLKEHGWCIVPHLKRTWIDMFEAFLVEANWFNSEYMPTLEEYLANGVTTGGAYMALVHTFFLMGQGVTKDSVAMMEPYPRLFSCSGRILRLWDDLGTAKEEQLRGDVASSIQCCMTDKTISHEDEARRHIRQIIRSLWVELNGELMASTVLPLSIMKASLNLARTAQVVYESGDDNIVYSVNNHAQALFYDPISSQLADSNHFMVGQGCV